MHVEKNEGCTLVNFQGKQLKKSTFEGNKLKESKNTIIIDHL